MPIQIDELLKPISEEEPAGLDLRYAPVSDQIREARRSEDAVSQGVWKREVKTADYIQVIDLSLKALRSQGKDLQVAAWLTEALLAREGVGGLRQGLELISGLLTNFWETVYPQIEDGDVEMRAMPLNWVSTQIDPSLQRVPLTLDGITWLSYTDSRAVPTEQDANLKTEKANQRQEAIEAGKLLPEKFEKSFEATPFGFYEHLRAELNGVIEYVKTLDTFCAGKLGAEAVDLAPLRSSLEELGKTVHVLFMKKGGRDGQPAGAATTGQPGGYVAPDAPVYQQAAPSYAVGGSGNAAAAAPAPAQGFARQTTGEPPQDSEAAVRQIVEAAHYLRQDTPFSPMSYLVLRAVRWGELRTAGYLDPSLAEAPPSNVRKELKTLWSSSDWAGVLETAERAMGLPCGRAWIDLQRYVVRAARSNGNDLIAVAVIAELQLLLNEFPELLEFTLSDDTPAVNPETKAWLEEERILPGQAPKATPAVVAPPPLPEPVRWTPPPAPPSQNESDPNTEPDPFQLAVDAVHSGRVAEGIRLMSDVAQKQPSGRARFLRTSQLASVCLLGGKPGIALPILRRLAAEIDEHRLEEWEEREIILQPLVMLYQTQGGSAEGDGARQELYERICRLDPVQALDFAP